MLAEHGDKLNEEELNDALQTAAADENGKIKTEGTASLCWEQAQILISGWSANQF